MKHWTLGFLGGGGRGGGGGGGLGLYTSFAIAKKHTNESGGGARETYNYCLIVICVILTLLGLATKPKSGS